LHSAAARDVDRPAGDLQQRLQQKAAASIPRGVPTCFPGAGNSFLHCMIFASIFVLKLVPRRVLFFLAPASYLRRFPPRPYLNTAHSHAPTHWRSRSWLFIRLVFETTWFPSEMNARVSMCCYSNSAEIGRPDHAHALCAIILPFMSGWGPANVRTSPRTEADDRAPGTDDSDGATRTDCLLGRTTRTTMTEQSARRVAAERAPGACVCWQERATRTGRAGAYNRAPAAQVGRASRARLVNP
jgi:hypothetical protein